MRIRTLVCLLFALLVFSCSSKSDSNLPPIHEPDVDMDTHDAVIPDLDPSDMPDTPDMMEPRIEFPTQWSVAVSEQAPQAVRWAAEDIEKYLTSMGRQVQMSDTPAECSPGVGTVVVTGDGVGTTALGEDATDQTFKITETRCGTVSPDGEWGLAVELSGGGLLGRQYAVYEWLHHLGVRFFHPEEEFIPAAPRFAEEVISMEHTPAFAYRSVSLHLTHPLELGDVFRAHDPAYIEDGRRYIDWQIKNLASFGTDFIAADPDPEMRPYGRIRGLPRGAGFALHNQQQGASGVIDPDDPRTDEEQIAEAIDAAMGSDPENYPRFFGFTFNPSEFTEIDDQDVVRQLTFLANYFAENYPNTRITATNHGTAGEPTPHYMVRYYDLPQFAPENLGVRVHTLMFYDLFRPAPVYGNENFNYLFDFMEAQHQIRPLWYYPEAAWWLTFDIPIPLYLPITIEARDRDIQGIKHMLEGKLEGHRVFGSGHEWGYWQNEYCPYRMSVYLDYRYRDCLEDIAWPMGEAANEVVEVLEDAIVFQERDFIYDAELLAYLVGSDPETEIAASVGMEFHPLPPAPRMIMRWSAEELDAWEAQIKPALERMDADYRGLIERLNAVRSQVSPDGLSWFQEVYDGLEATGLRARHSLYAYGAAVSMRRFQLTLDPQIEEEAFQKLEAAERTTRDVRTVVRRREQGYRYQPIARSIAGGPDGTEDENWTVYGYRYLNRTHHLYYYQRVNRLVREAMEGSADIIDIPNVIVGPQEPFRITIVGQELTDVSVDFGDGQVESGTAFEHVYQEPGIYVVQITGTLEEEPFQLVVRVARVIQKYTTGFTGRITEPSGTALIQSALPSIAAGYINGDDIVIGFSAREDSLISRGYFAEVDATPTDSLLATSNFEATIPVINRMQAEVMTSLTVRDASVRIYEDAGARKLDLLGDLSTDAVISAIVSVGGFEEEGARQLVAQILGYTPETLPETVAFVSLFDVD